MSASAAKMVLESENAPCILRPGMNAEEYRVALDMKRQGHGDYGLDEIRVPTPGSDEPFLFVTGSPKGSEGVMYNPARRDSLKNVF